MITDYELSYCSQDPSVGARVFRRITIEVLANFPLGIGAKPVIVHGDCGTEKKNSPRHQRATSLLIRTLQEKAPSKPSCFRSQEDWVRYLHQAEASGEMRVLLYVGRTGPGEANRGRIKTSDINPQIDFCRDCTPEQREAMTRAKRCYPPASVAPSARVVHSSLLLKDFK